MASPPGKKLQNILLLSGGEKALTALSLLVGIFQFQPAPFCVLDEVDAPLDETNVGRFAKLIAEMAEGTQFVVITHSQAHDAAGGRDLRRDDAGAGRVEDRVGVAGRTQRGQGSPGQRAHGGLAMKRYRFEAAIQRSTGWGAFVLFPHDVQAEFHIKGRVPVQALFGGLPYSGSLMPSAARLSPAVRSERYLHAAWQGPRRPDPGGAVEGRRTANRRDARGVCSSSPQRAPAGKV